MSGAVTAIAPFFAIVLIGWLSARRGMISEAGLGGLNAFIFNISLPPLLFLTMSRAPEQGFGEDGIGWAVLMAYGLATLTLYLGAMVIGAALFGLRGPARTLFGHLSANGNVGFLGLPLAIAALGPEAALPTAMILTFDIVVVMSATTLLLERARVAAPLPSVGSEAAKLDARPPKAAGGVGAALKAAFLNPIILGALGGVAWGGLGRGTLGWEMAEPLTRLLEVLGQAAAPAALFAVGATLAHKKSDRRFGEITAISSLKLAAHPALTLLALTLLAPQTPQLWFAAVVLAAANPASNNAVIFANIYRVYEARASAAVLASTAISLITFAALAAWMSAPASPN